jgi:hypothetical protein
MKRLRNKSEKYHKRKSADFTARMNRGANGKGQYVQSGQGIHENNVEKAKGKFETSRKRQETKENQKKS